MKMNNIFWVGIINLFIVSRNSFALEPFPTSGTCGENCTYMLDENGTLRIIGSKSGGTIDESVFYYNYDNSNVKNILIENTIKEIGSYAFGGFTNVKNIFIPESINKINMEPFIETSASIIFEGSPKNIEMSPQTFSVDPVYNSFTGTLYYQDDPETNEYLKSKTQYYNGIITNFYIDSEGKFYNIEGEYIGDSIEEAGKKTDYFGLSQDEYDEIKNIINTKNIKDEIEMFLNSHTETYTRDENGNYVFGNKIYATWSDMQLNKEYKPTYVARRIYTVEEATEAVSGKGKNTFSIRYR